MQGEWINVTAADGGSFRAYLAKPAQGSGPGIVLCQEVFGINPYLRDMADLFAEEGYVVIAPDLFWRLEPGVDLGYGEADMKKAHALHDRFDVDQGVRDIGAAVQALRAQPACKGKVGALGYCLGGKLAILAAAHLDVDCAVSYYGVGIESRLAEVSTCAAPLVLHFAGLDKFVPPAAIESIRNTFAARPEVEIYVYPESVHGFNTPAKPGYDKAAAGMAHSRTIALFRRVMGPVYNLSDLWENHIHLEFVSRDVDGTMKTMIGEPYVNHIPTMTGGYGAKNLDRFYRHHFVHKSPKDTKIIPVSRTVGADRVVDEGLFCFTHDIEIDWMLPGVPPTGKYVEIPLVAVINFRGDKLCHEHIYWDQASVLVQIGLLDPASFPVAGAETARKVLDPSLPSNTLMKRWAESA